VSARFLPFDPNGVTLSGGFMRISFTRFLLAILCVAPLCVSASLAQSNSGLDARRESLKKIIADEWEFELRESPIAATYFGDYRYNDQIDDMSIAATLRQDRAAREYLSRVEAIDTDGFPEQEQLNKALFARKLQQTIADNELKEYEMPLDQFNGAHLGLAQFPAVVPTDSAKNFDDYLTRLHQIPRAVDQIIDAARQGEKDKLMPPKFVLEEVAKQCDGIASAAGESSAFALPLKKFPAVVNPADQKRLHDATIAAIDTEVRPAFAKLAKFVRQDYEPYGRTEPGIWALPDGDARYRAAVREMTTTDMTPEQIYELGMSEVKSTEAQMTVIAKQQGYPDWKSYAAEIMNNPKLRATSREQILDTYRQYVAQMRPKLPELFGLLPKASVEVVPVEDYREKEAAAAFYFQGTPDGSRPGKVYVNTGDFKDRELPEIEATAYHEGIPGHHMQLSIQQELPALPPFRQHASYTAYIEGWGLYAERLGKDVGFYQDPNDEFERLASELFRAARLVEDTGVHYKRWSRDQMVQFFKENSLETGDDLQAEVDRYISYPGQALSYKIGQLKILELRKRAEDQLGGKFDIRAFHDEILSGGALPLDVLDTRTNAWIESVKSGKTATGQ
jgi:uncharacterized protein (DUF885 family)